MKSSGNSLPILYTPLNTLPSHGARVENMQIRRIFSIGDEDENGNPQKNANIVIRRSEEKEVAPPNPENSQSNIPPPGVNRQSMPESRYNPGLRESLQYQKQSGQRDLSELGKVEGTETAIRESVQLAQRNREKLANLVDNAQRVLLKVSTVFPFDFFPDDIVVDPIKITIVARAFIRSAQVRIVLMKDITNVLIETSPFFSTLKIIHGSEKTITKIQPLWWKDAVRTGSILQGLIAAKEQNIDITRIPIEESIGKIETLGRMRLAI